MHNLQSSTLNIELLSHEIKYNKVNKNIWNIDKYIINTKIIV